MAIGFSLPNFGKQSTGVPDYVGALSKGMDMGYKPVQQSQDLLAHMLTNKINEAKAKYAEKREAAALQSTLGSNEARSISNRELGQRLHAALTGQNLWNEEKSRMNDLKKSNPFLGMQGPVGQLGALIALQQHPELAGSFTNGTQTASQGEQGSVQSNQNSAADFLRKSIMNSWTPKETPAQKRAADFEDKLNLEKAKIELGDQAAEHKEIQAAEKDIPHLEKSLSGVKELLKIAKSNKDIFGHTLFPDVYARTSKNKNFGTWQNLLGDAIAGLEGKLSSKGNVLALKMASQLKPSHAESQQVAIGKLESMEKELQNLLNRSRKLSGRKISEPKYKDDDMVIVETPEGEKTMTYAEARRLGAE